MSVPIFTPVAPAPPDAGRDKIRGKVGIAIASYTPIVTDGGFGPLTFTKDTLPPGLSLNASTGVISGTPTGVVNATIQTTLSATNTNNETGTLSITFYITRSDRDQVTSSMWEATDPGANYTYTSTSDTVGAFFFYASLPPWLTGSGVHSEILSGIVPNNPSGGVNTWRINAGPDSGTVGNKIDVTLVISGGTHAQPIITSSPTVDLVVGDSLSYQITADNNPTHFDVNTDQPGISIDAATGLITSDAPFTTAVIFQMVARAINPAGPGDLTITVTVSDTGGGTPPPPPDDSGNLYPYVEINSFAEAMTDPCPLAPGTVVPPAAPTGLMVTTPGIPGSTTATATWM